MIRFISATSMLALALTAAPVAFAKDVRETKTFAKTDGTKVVAHTNFHSKTDVTDEKVTTTRTDGQIRTVSEKISPNHEGGFTVSKSVTGFSGQTRSSTSTVGAGHGGHGKA